MMKLNDKGFTLVELLATVAVLAIIMIVTIPNIIGVVQKNKNKTFIEDAKKFVSMAKYEYNKSLTNTGSVTYSLSDVDKNKELEDGPNGGKYKTDSRVVISGGTYTVYLIEKKDSTCYRLNGITEDQLFQDESTKYVKQVTCT